MDNAIRMSDVYFFPPPHVWEHGVLWVICRYKFLFTWMEPADGRVGSGPLQGKRLQESQGKTVTFLEALTACASFNPPHINGSRM